MTSWQRLARGLVIACCCGLAGVAAAAEPVSGYAFIDDSTRAMQDDDFENPGMLAVDQGYALFHEQREFEPYRCASCHEEDATGLDPGAIARYPVFDPGLGGLVTLQRRINYCWETNLDRFPLTPGDSQLIALETFVRHQAKGEPVNVQTDDEMAPLLARGEALYNTRFGQLDMACRHCHVQHQGQWLRGQRLSQGQANGFPEYRLGGGRITSFQQRLTECFVSFRAEPFEYGSEEYDLLELYVMSRGNGLPIETPAVRF
jgi:sulfur-oxidizing protein SoxA